MTAPNYNPDVLTCLANLSNDEVFTPPAVVNQMLDLLPADLWRNSSARFLDPACKTGVFLREIAKRLMAGLEGEIPNLQQRANHIFTKQLYGLAITQLTGMLARRSVYCSKTANGQFSVCDAFTTAEGNIRFEAMQHDWKDGRCRYCGASQTVYDRGEELEQHAYQFIHTYTPEEIFGTMKFDVIIGNPPYQMGDGGGEGSSAIPIYDKFVQRSMELNPRFLSMIIPARWYSGGKGLDCFRDEMLHDNRLRIIHDFPETSDCFPGINIRGGVCYFLWDRDHKGNCVVYNHKGGNVTILERSLLEKDSTTFIRYNSAISILNKVRRFKEENMDTRVQSRLPFGIPSNFEDYELNPTQKATIALFRSDRSKSSQKRVFVDPKFITKNLDWKDRKKVLVSKASPGGDEYPHSIISAPIYAEANSVCTETYLIVDFVNSKAEGQNLISYMTTRFFRFMMSLVKNTQNISRSVFVFVPVQDYSEHWTDKKLYKKYNLNQEEIDFIESMIRPME